MSTAMRRIALAVALVALGWLCWRAGRMEGRLAQAGVQLATLRYASALETYEAIDGSIGYLDATLLALLGRSRDVELGRTTARYWLAAFDEPRPGDQSVDRIVTANAVYRATLRSAAGEREALADRLQGAAIAYADVLRADPTQVDAAYNYEFVSRLRAELAAGRWPPRWRFEPEAPTSEVSGAGDPPAGWLPGGPTLHGAPGAPPLDPTVGELDRPFRIYVPLRPTERQESKEAGQGPRRPRKG